MIKIKQVLLTLLAVAAVISCNSNKSDGPSATAALKQYVDSVNSSNMAYTQENWTLIDNGYQERALKAEAELATMNEADKAELEASKLKYADLRLKYQAEMAKSVPLDYRVALRNSLFGEGKVGDDMKFEFATSGNLLSIYQSFVDAVDANKNNYSREDWDEIKVLYEALDTRKNAVEKTLAGSDNREIAGLKIKFASIYSTNRPGSKVRENADAKN